MNAQKFIKYGNQFPFDAPHSWWMGDGESPPPPLDWAHAAARGIIAELEDRRSVGQELESLMETEYDDIRKEIVEAIAEIIREAAVIQNP